MRSRIDAARDAILSAGSLIKETFGRELSGEVKEKDRNDFVTATDVASEKLITETLKSAFPEIGILAEEKAAPGSGKELWVIDPLDGTTNYIHGYPSIGVSIALVVENRVEIGLVYDPLREEMFEALRGGGAYCNSVRIRVSEPAELTNSLLGTGFPFKASGHIDRYLYLFKDLFLRCRGIRRAGAAVLDLSHVAAGRLDGFFELNLQPWDMAAGSLLVQEAGGRVTDFFGEPHCISRGNIIASSPVIHGYLVEAASRIFDRDQLKELSNDLIQSEIKKGP